MAEFQREEEPQMSVETVADGTANVESMFANSQATPVSDELGRLRKMLLELGPCDAIIKFEFDGRLRLHIDVRRVEDVAMLEAVLPSLSGGIFHDVQRGMAGHNSFRHRVSALVTR